MLQVMASNHPGPTIPNLGPKWAWALMVQERVMGLWTIPQDRIWGSGGISTEAILRRSSQSPSQPKSARPQASGMGFDRGKNASVESRVWDMGSSSFQPCSRPARPRQKCLGREEICRGAILSDPLAVSQGFPCPMWIPHGESPGIPQEYHEYSPCPRGDSP